MVSVCVSTAFDTKLCQRDPNTSGKNFHNGMIQLSPITFIMDTTQLLEIYHFLEKVSEFNEDTEFDPADEPKIDLLRSLVEARNQTVIAEEFNKPFLHPMVTVQQHVEALKELVRQELAASETGSQQL